MIHITQGKTEDDLFERVVFLKKLIIMHPLDGIIMSRGMVLGKSHTIQEQGTTYFFGCP